VWLARDAELDTFVAIKVFKADLTPTQRERLRREVMLGRTLQHPGLVRIYELIDGGDRLAVAMEWVPEGSLTQRLEAGPLAIDEVVRVAEQVLEVLAYLHGMHVVHRDIKPSNLLIDSDGRVRLADLGLARPLDDDRGLTKTLAAVGTPAYMSPEQIRGEEPAPAADLYGLGVTLYQLVTGAVPFSGTSEFDVANKHLTIPVDDPRKLRPDCPAWLAGFILRLLEKLPRDRFGSAAKALAALRRRRSTWSPSQRRQRLRVGLLAGVGLAALAVALLALWSRGEVASVTVAADTVSALTRNGKVLWSRRFEGAEPRALVADVIGDREPEVVVGVVRPDGHVSSTNDLFVFDRTGDEKLALASGRGVLDKSFGDVSDIVSGPVPFAFDLDGDGRPEIIWKNQHRFWFPSIVGVWSPRSSSPARAILANSGHVQQVRSADLDGDGRGELIVLATNNPLGAHDCLVVLKDTAARFDQAAGGDSPDLLLGWNGLANSASRSVVSYTLLGASGAANEIVSAGRGGIVVRSRGDQITRFDSNGNLQSSPLFGKGPAPRQRFWDELVVLCLGLETGSQEPAGVAALRERHADVMAEPAMRLATALLAARSLAIGGQHRAAISVLAGEAAVQPGERDLALRLGEQLAIAGDYDRAMAELQRAASSNTVGRDPFDAIVAQNYLASVRDDSEGRDRALASQRGYYVNGEVGRKLGTDLNSIWAFCRGDWASAALGADKHSALLPAVDVLREWANLERGGDPATIAAHAEDLAGDPEARDLARLLRAHALVRAGRSDDARASAAAAAEALVRKSRTDVSAYVLLALAHWVEAEIAHSLGDGRAAKEHLSQAATIAPGCWFGRPPGSQR